MGVGRAVDDQNRTRERRRQGRRVHAQHTVPKRIEVWRVESGQPRRHAAGRAVAGRPQRLDHVGIGVEDRLRLGGRRALSFHEGSELVAEHNVQRPPRRGDQEQAAGRATVVGQGVGGAEGDQAALAVASEANPAGVDLGSIAEQLDGRLGVADERPPSVVGGESGQAVGAVCAVGVHASLVVPHGGDAKAGQPARQRTQQVVHDGRRLVAVAVGRPAAGQQDDGRHPPVRPRRERERAGQLGPAIAGDHDFQLPRLDRHGCRAGGNQHAEEKRQRCESIQGLHRSTVMMAKAVP